jgi:hypothetical protein
MHTGPTSGSSHAVAAGTKHIVLAVTIRVRCCVCRAAADAIALFQRCMAGLKEGGIIMVRE